MMTETPEDSSTDVPDDSSTVVSDESDADGKQTTDEKSFQEARAPSKRRAEESPSPPDSKQQKLSHGTAPTAELAQKPEDVVDFLKSRPQISTMNNAQKASRSQKETIADQDQSVMDADGLVLNTAFEGNTAAWQHNETVLEFLRRLPVENPDSANVGPWLWVGSKMCKPHWNRSGRVDAFTEQAEPLLADICAQRVKLEQSNPEKAASTITRKMGPYRDQLQVDLLNAATNVGLTSGKWMLFPKVDDLPRVWRRVAEATAEGKLGPTSKVATFDPQNVVKGTLICVYTYDFSDLDDVKRVLCSLYDLNILRRDVTVYYKCDAYTHLGIFSDNQYKLRASLYSSEEVFNDKVKYTDGAIARLQKRTGSIGEFFS